MDEVASGVAARVRAGKSVEPLSVDPLSSPEHPAAIKAAIRVAVSNATFLPMDSPKTGGILS